MEWKKAISVMPTKAGWYYLRCQGKFKVVALLDGFAEKTNGYFVDRTGNMLPFTTPEIEWLDESPTQNNKDY
jgi:hypothetical protein